MIDGGAILPDGEFYRVEVPTRLIHSSRVDRSYRNLTFDRKLAMRRKQARLAGLGHPLIEALLAEWQKDEVPGAVTALRVPGTEPALRAYCLADVAYEDGRRRKFPRTAELSESGSWRSLGQGQGMALLQIVRDLSPVGAVKIAPGRFTSWQAAFEEVIRHWEAEIHARQPGVLSVRVVLCGLALCAPEEHPA